MFYALGAVIVGFGVGWFARRWTAVVIVAAVCVAVSLAGTVFGWFATEDTPALGGAIILWLFFFAPLVIAVAVGVRVPRRGAREP